MPNYIHVNEISVDRELHDFVTDELLPGTGVDPTQFWSGASEILNDLGPRNRALLEKRDALQAFIDTFHKTDPGMPEPERYRTFLTEIGYLVPEPEDFTITTRDVDAEIAELAGPQLVVPLLNARFATNAVNARWGSLYDALYGTDAIVADGDLAPARGYNRARGEAVIAWARNFLDEVAPLAEDRHSSVVEYTIANSALVVELKSGLSTALIDPRQFVGFIGEASAPTSILLRHNGLHVEIQIDRAHSIGETDTAGVSDVVLESALTSIMDFEDSVAAVDAHDKTIGYRNWLLLMKGELSEQVTKTGTTFTRAMNPDRVVSAPDGARLTLPGRALMLIRHVGHLMTTDAVLGRDGNEVGEGILDALMTAVGAMHDLSRIGGMRNSRTGSVYIVKPKMHGPEEVAFTAEIFDRVERMLGLPPLTLKIGVMDEERRTSVNLKASIAAADGRIVFINTGFLDRTGDEIHTSLHAGPVTRKADLREQRFLQAYEDHNVDVALATGFPHRAQIGKGMWAMPDLMADMLEQKIAHPLSGATTAWVPSPTAATLHATHYHLVDPFLVQDELSQRKKIGVAPILIPPLAKDPKWTPRELRQEVDNNIQSILGYVVRWVDQGIGCSKVPDLHGVSLMEDRATLRISSQLLANWLAHGVISEAEILESLHRIAPLVDSQNAGDPLYEALVGPSGPGLAFEAARDLVLLGASQPNGYTEPILHRARRAKKALRR